MLKLGFWAASRVIFSMLVTLYPYFNGLTQGFLEKSDIVNTVFELCILFFIDL